jgi:murein DD-endopeptidase MepM/ murein hydrolase activator NlpD
MTQEKNAILAEKARGSSTSRRRPTPAARWIAALMAIPLLGVVAAFAIAPGTATETVVVHRILEEVPIALPARDADTAALGYWREELIQRGDTIGSLLARLQITDPKAANYLRNAGKARALYQLVPGRSVRTVTNADGSMVTLRYVNTDGTELVVERRGDDFFTREDSLPGDHHLLMSSGEVKTSLFAATDDAGLSDAVAIQLADIFSSEVDFHRGLRAGDRFSVVFEGFYSNGELVRTGRIVAAEFINAGRSYRAVYFQDASGRGGYYTPDGKSMRKSFLRSPLEFSRISSGFSLSRFHPVLQTWRAHKGVDYAAPTGTRVKATADGIVEQVGRQGGYGNLVVIRHSNGYSTAYGHLSSFAGGLHAGQRIAQSDVIGFVGSSGLATGPHLHYEFRVNGIYQNPLKVGAAPGLPITIQIQAAFEQRSRPLLSQLDLVRGIDLAVLN